MVILRAPVPSGLAPVRAALAVDPVVPVPAVVYLYQVWKCSAEVRP